MSGHLAVGLMSGTSLDGVSAALVQLETDPPSARLVAFRQEPYAAAERGQIIDAIARGGAKELALLHVALAERFAGAVLQLLAAAKTSPRDLSLLPPTGRRSGTSRAARRCSSGTRRSWPSGSACGW